LNVFTTELGRNIFLGDKRQTSTTTSNNPQSIDMTDYFNSGGFSNNNNNTTGFTNTTTITEGVNSVTLRDGVSSSSSIDNANKTSIINTLNSIKNLDDLNLRSPSYLDDTNEERKTNVLIVKKEFNALADMLNIQNKSESNTFKLDLFKVPNKSNNLGFRSDSQNDDDDMIEIERHTSGIDKAKGMFDDFDIGDKKNDDDNLLDLMDIATNK
jgi:hypothetical protein